jgi:putative addiction module component (TIGR02574 family)
MTTFDKVLESAQLLTAAERFRLAQEIWDSIVSDPDWVLLTDSQRQDLD